MTTLLAVLLFQDPAALVEKLKSDDVDARASAAEDLVKLGEPAIAALTKAIEGRDVEVKGRAEGILRRIGAKLAPTSLKLAAVPEKKAYGPRETVKVRLKLTNSGPAPIVVVKENRFEFEDAPMAFDEIQSSELKGTGPDGKAWPIVNVSTFSSDEPPPAITVTVPESALVVLAPGESIVVAEEEAEPVVYVQRKAVSTPHAVGKYRFTGSYRFSPDKTPKHVTLKVDGPVAPLWECAFRGELKAEAAEFEVKE